MKQKGLNLYRKVLNIFPVIILAIAFIVYYPSLFGEFVLDDITYFVENDLLTQKSPLDIVSIFSEPSNYWGEFLPVRDYLYVLEYYFFREHTLGYHLISLLLFLVAGFVLYNWVKALLNDYYPTEPLVKGKLDPASLGASVIVALFLLHPMYVECVAYISGQKDILSMFFILISLSFLYKAGKQSFKNGWIFVLGVCFHYLAVLSKLGALSTIIFVPLLWYISTTIKFRKLLKMTLVWLLANLPVAWWFLYASQQGAAYQPQLAGSPFLERIPRALNIIGIHLNRTVWPYPLSFSYPFNAKWALNLDFLIGFIFLALTILCFIKWRRSLATLGLLLFLIYLLPVVQIYPEMANALLFDRYLAIPLIGLFIVLIDVMKKLKAYWKTSPFIYFGMFVVVAFALGRATASYIPKFKSNIHMSEYMFKLYPTWSTTPFNFAFSLIEDNQMERAELLLKSNMSLEHPNWVKPYFYGKIKQKKGHINEAYELFYKAAVMTRKGGYFPFADSHLAEIMIQRKDYKSAQKLLNGLLYTEIKNPVVFFKAKQLLKVVEAEISKTAIEDKKP